MRIPYIILALFLILNCSRNRDSNGGGDETLQREKSDSALVLLTEGVLHNFSSPANKDTFKIVVTGSSIREGTVHFQIVTHDNRIIYDEKFTTDWFLDYGADGDTTELQKENYITTRINNFFNEENFLQPAIKKTDRYDADYSDRKNWEDIKSDASAVGFKYLVGKEDGRRIAYSKQWQKVVLYYNCC